MNGKNLPDNIKEYDKTKRLRYVGHEMSLAEIGCFLSHRLAWMECLNTQKPTLILEDDFLLKMDLADILSFIENNSIKFDVLRLQGIFAKKFKIIKNYGDRKLIAHLGDPAGSTAYIIHPTSANALLAKSQHFFIPIDDFIAQDWKHHLKVLSILPYPISTQNLTSTIADRQKATLSLKNKLLRELFRLPDGIMRRFYRILKTLRV